MTHYSIRDLEALSGIKAHTIRIWEKRYGIIKPQRTDTNIRFYTDDDLKSLLNIAMLNKNGFKISKLGQMDKESLNKAILGLTQSENDTDIQINGLMKALIELDRSEFDRIISDSINQRGFDYTITYLLSQFLNKVGVLWQTGAISPMQEHFISNLIRHQLIVATEFKAKLKPNPKKFLLFLPENEYHELALLYFKYLIRKLGHKVIYLGQNVPLSYLKPVLEMKTVDYLVSSLSTHMSDNALLEFLNELLKISGNRKVILGGQLIKHTSVKLPSNIVSFENVKQFQQFVESL